MAFLEKVYRGNHQWYLYVFTLLVVFIATQIGGLPLALYIQFKDPAALQSGNIAAITGTNMGLTLVLLTFITGFFALFLAVRYIHGEKFSDIVTGRNRIDFRRILFGAGIWGGLSLLTVAVQLLFSDSSDIVFQFQPARFFVLVIISLLLFPFQTSFEELIFRGYLMQWFAYLFRYRWIALFLTSFLFGLMHGANPEVEEFGIWVALPQYILMGLILGYITLKDDGTELALGLHMANNILMALTFTSDASALQTPALFKSLHPTASHWDTLFMLATGILFIWICNRKFHFRGKINIWEKIHPLPVE